MTSQAALRIAIAGIVLASAIGCDKLGLFSNSNPIAPSGPPVTGSTIVYTAIGASDVTGVGSSFPCPLSDCPSGTGYVQDAIRQLRTQGFVVNVNNLGIPTGVIGPDFQTLGQSNNRTIVGNFILNEVPFVQQNATLVTIFAGVNEVDTITAALGNGAGGSDPNGYIDSQVAAFAADYAKLLTGIRVIAGAPRIVVLNVPNVAGLPYLSAASSAQRQTAQRIAIGMTQRVNALISSSVSIIDLMCDARSYIPSNYSSDGLHPNDAGYTFIAGELVRAVTSTAYPAPQSSCAAMTIAG